IGQLITFVFQEHRAHGLVLSLKKTLNLVLHIIVLFFTGSSRPWGEARCGSLRVAFCKAPTR
ncbi:hypothetical protein ACC717_37010, partial [Rhizobium ruizarguesonis]